MDSYTRIASVYDALTASFLSGPREALAAHCARLKAGRILDMGCGTGILARMLRPSAACVVGLDASPAMLGQARKLAAALPAALRPHFVLGDASRPPFACDSFDALVFSFVLHETAANAEAMLREAFRLAPLALVLEWRMPERNLDYPLTAWSHIIESLAGREHYRHFRAFMRNGGLRGLAARSGADILEEQSLKAGSLCLAVLRRR